MYILARKWCELCNAFGYSLIRSVETMVCFIHTTVPPEESVKYSLHEYLMQYSALSQFQQQNT
jgi:hypothetical protein